MSLILLTSILIRFLAVVYSILLLQRMRYWPLVFLTLMLALMTLRQILTLFSESTSWTRLELVGHMTELPGLVVSMMALVAVIAVERIIGAKRQSEEALQERGSRLSAILEEAVEGIITINERGIIESINPSAEQMFGYLAEEVIGRNVNMLMPEPYHSQHDGYIANYVQTGEAKIIGKGREVQGQRKNGEIFPMDLSVSDINVNKRRLFTGIVRDITSHKIAEQERLAYQQELRSLSSELSISEEQERRRIATDLHDEVSQTLAMAKIKLGEAQQGANSTEVRESLVEARRLVDQTIQTVRSLTFDLGSPVLYELGLEAALEALAEDFEKEHGIRCRFDDDGQEKFLTEDLRIMVFRSVRELLINVVKYAKAKSVRLSFIRSEGDVRVLVKDDGVGFNVPKGGFQPTRDGGFGLFNISERLNHLGGRFEVESAPDAGTQVVLVLPMKMRNQKPTG